MKKTLPVIVAILFTCLIPSAHAFRFSPMVVEFKPSGSGTTQTFTLENNSAEKVALQIEVFQRNIDLNGKEMRSESNDFMLYPQQLSLEPHEKRNIRATWVGSATIEQELAYRIVATQLPVQFKNKEKKTKATGANISFLLQYVASVYVTPENAAAKISVESAKALHGHKAELILKNSGSAHRVLNGINIYFSASGKKWEASKQSLKNIESENILPGKKRRFIIPLPDDFPNNGLHAEISFK